ncbi:NAD(P)/FAD-dependent oxidoreductase [Patescibacteria group bacterium]|nr:NAD(P)/FAD-dependent oxidoreductase [Patescibacteria group bacterium]
MRVGIVGAGFVGLTCAYRLAQAGVEVELYEAASHSGGLASGFSLPGWKWPLEQFYHHIFSNDRAIIRLSREVGWPPIFFRPTTSIFFNGRMYPFDSAFHLLRFPQLPLHAKLRMGIVLGFLKLSPFWKPLERIPAHDFLIQTMGVRGYEAIWQPLLVGKFGPWARDVNAAWFWARIHKRTARLGYFRRGFQGLANRLHESIVNNGGGIHLHSPVSAIRKAGAHLALSSTLGTERFDRVIVTTSTPLFLKMVKGLPSRYRSRLGRLRSLDALVVILILKTPVMDGVYWLNVTDQRLPFVGVMEHTNMIDPKYYGGNHIVYLGTYLPPDHRYFLLSKDAVVRLAIQQLKALTRNFDESDIVETRVHRGRGAQPIIPVNYSRLRPTMETPIDHLFLANMSLVYPWDRGTNYAVELGERAYRTLLS